MLEIPKLQGWLHVKPYESIGITGDLLYFVKAQGARLFIIFRPCQGRLLGSSLCILFCVV